MALCSGDDLIDLRDHWGGAYDINFDGQTWTARRKDNRQILTAADPEALREKIRKDYRSNPVPRPPLGETGDDP
jgi:hypothetical protein